jgi:preprotein translocase subunit YajC
MDYTTLLTLAAVIVAGYFLMVRPARKRQAEQLKAVSSIEEGSRVLTTSGVLATVRHLGERQAVIEIAPGVEMTVMKAALVRVLKADEEEFEYEDDAEVAPDHSTADAFGAAIAGFDAPDAEDPQAAPEPGATDDPYLEGPDFQGYPHPDQQK